MNIIARLGVLIVKSMEWNGLGKFIIPGRSKERNEKLIHVMVSCDNNHIISK